MNWKWIVWGIGIVTIIVVAVLAVNYYTTYPRSLYANNTYTTGVTVTVPTGASSAAPYCTWSNSSHLNDWFCVWVTSAPNQPTAGQTTWTLSGTMSHGPGTQSWSFALPGYTAPTSQGTSYYFPSVWYPPDNSGNIAYVTPYQAVEQAHG